MGEMLLPTFMYFIVGISIIFYAVLDGFDLGVGMLHLSTKSDYDRRIFLNAIGPVWDGNEVWLVIVLGAMLAAFPPVYATLLSSFYMLCMILILCLIFRAVSIEFRSKQPSKRWRSTWDAVFSVTSFIISFIIGITLGNLIVGIPLDEHGNFLGSFWDFFGCYPVLIGLLSISLFRMHGAIFLAMKTEGKLHEQIRKLINPSIILFSFLYLTTTLVTMVTQPHMMTRMLAYPVYFLIPLCAFTIIANIPRMIRKKKDGWAFISSCLGIALFMGLFSVGTYPAILRSSINPEEHSLTILNSSSSALTLKVLFIIVIIGVPMVLAYGYWIYRVFRGKVKLSPTSY